MNHNCYSRHTFVNILFEIWLCRVTCRRIPKRELRTFKFLINKISTPFICLLPAGKLRQFLNRTFVSTFALSSKNLLIIFPQSQQLDKEDSLKGLIVIIIATITKHSPRAQHLGYILYALFHQIFPIML